MKKKLVKPLENKRTFFKRISEIYSVYDWRYKLIEKAYDDAKDAFREKYREGGERYFEHLRGTTLILIDYLGIRDYRLIIAALLHDIVEDIPSWIIQRVCREYDKKIALLVDYVSKPSEKDYPDKKKRNQVYHDKLGNAPRKAIILKLADRWHNLLTLWACPVEKILRKIEETRKYYLPLAKKHNILFHELESAIAVLEKRLKKGEK